MLIISSIACCTSESDIQQAIDFSDQIPKVDMLENDPRLSMGNDGRLLLDSTLFSGYLVSFHANNSIKSKKGYLKGRLEGEFMAYHPNGQVYHKRPYHLGEKHGEHLGYYEDGKIKFQYFFREGFNQGTHKQWYANGNLKRVMNYKDGKEFGLQQVWQPNGKMRSNYVVRENGRRYGMQGLKRCAKIDSETGDVDPYKGNL